MTVGVVETMTTQPAFACSGTFLSIAVSPTTASIAQGQTKQFVATGTFLLPSCTANLTNSVTWSSSITSTATVSNSSGSRGLATATASGSGATTITATSGLIAGTAVLTVTPAVLTAISVSPTAASVAQGQSQQFSATGTYSDLSTANLTNSVTWSSSVTGTATVSNTSGSQGLATGVATGATTITATSGLIAGMAALTVVPVVPPPPTPLLTTTPGSGKKRMVIMIQGTNFEANQAVIVKYLSKTKNNVLCQTTVNVVGSFSCKASIPHGRRAGKRGQHVIMARESSGTQAKARFTLTN